MKQQSSAAAARDPYSRQRLAAVMLAVFILISSLLISRALAPERVPVVRQRERPCLIVDPGHGGPDGGALAYNGVKESDLNLSISLKLRDLAAFYGCPCILTREDDSTKSDGPAYSEHEDLVRRTELANGKEGAVLISIHQNTFPTSQPSGAQVLYGVGPESRRLGELTHAGILSALQPENRRVAAPASSGLYLASHVNCPFILVECGFLTNLSDLQQLCDGNYQSELAAVLLSSFLQYSAQPNV